MTISETIDHLEHIQNIAGDIHVGQLRDICGEEYVETLSNVLVETTKDGEKYAVIVK